MSAAFDYQLRVLLCPQCGAPVEVSPALGVAPCRYCGARAEVGVRDEALDAVLRPERVAISEQERLHRLRAQTDKPLTPPAAVAHLFQDGAIAPWRLAEAVNAWQAERHAARASGGPDASEVVYFLAMALSSLYGDQGDSFRQRAVLESSLEVLRLPRHRQALRCMLARLACRAGDPAAAEAWLAPCDPSSDDLEMDTPYRLSRAVVATARGRLPEVLAHLGRLPDDVPVLEAMGPVCLAFRANAVERMGDPAGAAKLLAGLMAEGGARAVALERGLAYWAPFGLCPASVALASASLRAQRAETAVQRSGGGVGTLFFVLGLIMGGLGALLIVIAVVAGVVGAVEHSRGDAMEAGAWALTFALIMGGGPLFLTGLVFGGVGFMLRRAAANARRLALTGRRAQARVKDVRPTGVSINGASQYSYTLLVEAPGGGPPYAATVKALGAPRARAGMSVTVTVDPENPAVMLLEEGA